MIILCSTDDSTDPMFTAWAIKSFNRFLAACSDFSGSDGSPANGNLANNTTRHDKTTKRRDQLVCKGVRRFVRGRGGLTAAERPSSGTSDRGRASCRGAAGGENGTFHTRTSQVLPSRR